jgi:hypothetical protein
MIFYRFCSFIEFNYDEFLPFVRRFVLGEGDEDDEDAERNCGFSYGKLIRDRFEALVLFFRVPLPLTGGESKFKYTKKF